MENIFDWSDIADDFREGLVLGNGASIAIDSGFSYRSLRAAARDRDDISDDVNTVFEHLRTSDFEIVLRILWHANQVNEALGVHERKTADAYISVKSALINIVRSIHPSLASVEPHLTNASSFMGRFQTVASLSYDLLVYWAMNLANRTAQNRFKDCWIHGVFQQDWEQYRVPYPPNDEATLVVFPHGNLVIEADFLGSERKVNAEVGTLLETITRRWEEGRATPVFVSEGLSEQKRRSIHRSPYLSTVFAEVLPELGQAVAMYGWSMADEDDHILYAICRKGRPRLFAVSVDPSSADCPRVCGAVRTKLRRLYPSGRFEVRFYDRASAVCWINE